MIKTGLIACLFLAVVCCGSDASYRQGTFRDSEVYYKVGIMSKEWSRIDLEGQNHLAWHNASLQATIQVNASCDPGIDVPLEALTNHLLIGFTERQISEQSLVSMDKREALRTLLVAKLDGVPRKMALMVLKKDGCIYDFSLITPPDEHFAQAFPHFESLLSGFTTERGQ
jgi:hypothetical protein